MARRRLTGVAVGIPLGSASLTWEYVDENRVPGDGSGCLVLPGRRLPKVRQIADAAALGVHPSGPAEPRSFDPAGRPLAERVPAYVPRDVDGDLHRRLGESGFVVIVGDSSAGKSRAAFEAVRCLPEHVLIAPQSHAAMPLAIEKALAPADVSCGLMISRSTSSAMA